MKNVNKVSIAQPFVSILRASKLSSLVFVAVCVSACGGGGAGGESSNSVTQVSSVAAPESVVASGEPVETPVEDTQNEVEEIQSEITYTPSDELLLEDAESSSELYVEEAFNFDQTKTVRIQLQADYTEGGAISNKIVKIKALDSDLEEWDDSIILNAALVHVAKTNTDGELTRVIELPMNVEKLVIEISAVGLENRVVLDINNSLDQTVAYHFK